MQAPDSGINAYASPHAHQWYRETVAHNTLVADGKSQLPATGRLHLFADAPRIKFAEATPTTEHEESMPFARMRRMVALVDDAFVVDICRMQTRGTHDWVYHSFGRLRTDQPMQPQVEPLGKDHGYQHITNVRRGRPSGETWGATWSQDDQGVRLTMLADSDMEFITGAGPGPQIRKDDPGLKGNRFLPLIPVQTSLPLVVARSTKQDTLFRSIIEPFKGEPLTTGLAALSVTRHGHDLVTEGVALRIDDNGRVVYVLYAYTWGNKEFGDMHFDGQAAAVFYDKAKGSPESLPAFIYIVEGSRLVRGAVGLCADRQTTMYLQRMERDRYLFEHQRDTPASITLIGDQWRASRIVHLDDRGQEVGQVESHHSRGQMSFDVQGCGRYRITVV